jgi:hypothetical protein
MARTRGVSIKGKGKMKLVSNTIESINVLYIPAFLFRLLFVLQLTFSFNFKVLFTLYKVIFQGLITKKMIGGGFHLHGLYYFSPDSRVLKGFQVVFTLINEHLLWHHRPTHPLTFIF